MPARDPCTSVTKYIQHGHYKVGQVSLLTAAAKPTETPAREKRTKAGDQQKGGGKKNRMGGVLPFISVTEDACEHACARLPVPFSWHAVTVVFLERRGSDRTDKNSMDKGLGLSPSQLSSRARARTHDRFCHVIYNRDKSPALFP